MNRILMVKFYRYFIIHIFLIKRNVRLIGHFKVNRGVISPTHIISIICVNNMKRSILANIAVLATAPKEYITILHFRKFLVPCYLGKLNSLATAICKGNAVISYSFVIGVKSCHTDFSVSLVDNDSIFVSRYYSILVAVDVLCGFAHPVHQFYYFHNNTTFLVLKSFLSLILTIL